jgi:hypothetical protein
MTPYEKVLAILTILLFCAWLFSFWLDEELEARKEHHLWPYD